MIILRCNYHIVIVIIINIIVLIIIISVLAHFTASCGGPGGASSNPRQKNTVDTVFLSSLFFLSLVRL